MSEEKKFTQKSYHDGLAESKLEGTKCTNCGTHHLPPRHVCPSCNSRKLEWKEYTGDGVITGLTIITVAPPFMAEMAPYNMAIVKLDEGPSITGILETEDEANIGDRVTTDYTSVGEKTILQFKPHTD